MRLQCVQQEIRYICLSCSKEDKITTVYELNAFNNNRESEHAFHYSSRVKPDFANCEKFSLKLHST